MKLQPKFKSARAGLTNHPHVLSCMKNNIPPHNLALLKIMLVLRLLIWPTLLKVDDDIYLFHSVIVVRKLGIL
jgi:hypothetical protein